MSIRGRGRASRSALSAGKVRMKSSIAPPRITRMRFMRFTVETLCERRNQSSSLSDSRTATDLVSRKREPENYESVSQHDRMQATPAKNTASAPIDLIAKDVRNRHPEQARDNEQVSKYRHEQAARFVTQKGRIKKRFGHEQTENPESAYREKFIYEKQREHVTNW